MKVLILVNHDLVVYNFRKELVEELLNEGFNVVISSPYGSRINKLVEMGAQHKPVEIKRHSFNPIDELRLLKEYRKLIKNVEPDIILSYTIKPNIYGSIAAKEFNIPIIANVTGLGNGINDGGLKNAILLKLYKYAFKKTNIVFFQNIENKKYLESKLPIKGRTLLLPGSGVNLEQFKFFDYPNSNCIRITYAGRIMESKGITEYLEAIKILNLKYFNVKYKFIGFFEDEKYREKFEKYQQDCKNIQYYEHREDIIPLLIDSEVVILPSHHEGMSNALLEAAALGRPLLASNIHGCKEIIEEGKNGFLFEVKNSKSIATSIEKFLELPLSDKKKMGQYSREKVEKEFDRNKVVEIYMDTIKQLLSN